MAHLGARRGEPGQLLDRIRLLFYAFAVFTLVTVAPSMLASPPRLLLVGLLALAGLAGLWTGTWRRGDFRVACRVLEPGLLLIATSAATVPAALTGVFYVGLFYGALHGSRRATIVRGGAYFIAFALGHVVVDGWSQLANPQVFAHSWGALASSIVMSLLADHVRRQEASEQAKDEFLAVVSHELRTPLTSTLGFLYMLEQHGERMDAAQRQQLLTRARVQAERQKTLIEDLLDVARVLDGTLAPLPRQVDVGRVVDEVTASLGLEAHVRQDIDPRLRVLVDENHLRHMLANLLSNADKYGAPPIVLRTHLDGDGRHVVLEVIDHGPGVDPGFRSKLFTRFSQASTGDRRTAEGVGLGLWLTRAFARVNRGEVSYEPGETGARFVLRLPTAAAQQQPDIPVASMSPTLPQRVPLDLDARPRSSALAGRTA